MWFPFSRFYSFLEFILDLLRPLTILWLESWEFRLFDLFQSFSFLVAILCVFNSVLELMFFDSKHHIINYPQFSSCQHVLVI